MNVLVLYEFSGVVREAFRKAGHHAISCDLLPALDGQREYHYQGDAFDCLDLLEDWADLVIAHPECTMLTNSSVRWFTTIPKKPKKGVLYGKPRWRQMIKDAADFKRLLACKVKMIAVENPVPHGHALKRIGRKYDQIIQPYQFGHGELKKTCLWLKGLPKLKPTKQVRGRKPRVHHESPGVKGGLTRAQRRSITYAGVADAFVAQWGCLK